MNMDENTMKEYIFANRKLIMYPDLSVTGRLFGGKLLSWIDESAALMAMEHMCTQNIVTKKISEVTFESPALLGDILELWYQVSYEGRSSLSLDCRVVVRHLDSEDKTIICNCSITFVAINSHGKPTVWNR